MSQVKRTLLTVVGLLLNDKKDSIPILCKIIRFRIKTTKNIRLFDLIGHSCETRRFRTLGLYLPQKSKNIKNANHPSNILG